MAEVTDPSILSQLEGKATGRAAATDLKQAEDARSAASSARDSIKSFGHLYDISSRYPGGIPQKTIDAVKAGVGATDQTTQDYRLFDAMSRRAAMGQAKMLTPVSNTDIGLLIASGPNPALRSQNNHALIDMDYPKAARALLENRMKANWIERYGSLSAKMKNGQTFGDAYRKALLMPQVKAAMRPVSKIVGRKGGLTRVSNEADYAKLPSGAQYTAPDGSIRTKR